ncbi:MAG: hypothetical protein J6W75_10740 [Bacteroidaceae bacterium]|nr:hypothetical protein [Bacteroidaceae bacterium]
MKKIIILLLAMLTTSVSMQAGDPTEKQIKKAVKAKKKDFKKQKWELYGTAQTMDMVLYNYYKELYAPGSNIKEVTGLGAESENKTILHQKAIMDAARTYSQNTCSQVEVKAKNALSSISKEELDDFRQTFTSNVSKQIGGQLKECFSVIRASKTSPGYYEMQTFFLLDERNALNALKEAMRATYIERKFKQEMLEPLMDAVSVPGMN